MSLDMGCGSSKRTAVMPVGDSVGDTEAKRGPTRRTSELPALEGEDPPAEQLKEGTAVRPLENNGNWEPMGLYCCNITIKRQRQCSFSNRFHPFFTAVHSQCWLPLCICIAQWWTVFVDIWNQHFIPIFKVTVGWSPPPHSGFVVLPTYIIWIFSHPEEYHLLECDAFWFGRS
jgi:hypothetical protein